MASKKKKSNVKSVNNQKKLTVEDLKKKNVVLKKKNGSNGAKGTIKNKEKSVKTVSEINKKVPKNIAKEEINVELEKNIKDNLKIESKNKSDVAKNVKIKDKNVKNKAQKKNNGVSKSNIKDDLDTEKVDVDKTVLELTDKSKVNKTKKNQDSKVPSVDIDNTSTLNLDSTESTLENVNSEKEENSSLINETKSKKIQIDIKEKIVAFYKSIVKSSAKVNKDDKVKSVLKKKDKNDNKKLNKAKSSNNGISKDVAGKNKNKNKNIKSKKKNFIKSKNSKSKKKVYKSSKDIELQLKYLKRKKILSTIAFICIAILVVELCIFLYLKLFRCGDNSYDALNSIIFDDTSLISVGSSYFKYSDNFEETSRIEKGRFVKYDKRGKLELEIQYDRGINSTFTSVVRKDDAYYVVGSGEFSKEQESDGVRDAILVKYSLEGKKLWEKSYSVLTDTRFNKIILVEDGLVVIGQSIYQNMEMGNHNTGGGIIVKYDFDGEVIWTSNHGGNKSGNFNDVIFVNKSYYVVGKDSKDTGVLVKFNSAGKYVFHKNYSYTDNLGFSSITTDGVNLYVAGSKKILSDEEQADENSSRNTNNTDALIVKYSLDGDIIKEKTFGGSGHERYNSIVYYGNVLYLVGSTSSNDSGLRVSSKNGEITAMLLKCDTNLSITRKDVFGGSGDDNMLDLITDGSNVYMVGYSNSNDSNIKTEHDNGSDFISKLVKVDFRFRILMKK